MSDRFTNPGMSGFRKRERAEPQVVLLDLDGTLVDSEGLAAAVFEDYLRANGISLGREREVSKSVVGRTWRNGLLEAQSRGASFREDLGGLAERLNLAYRQRLEHEGVLEIPGAATAVRQLAKLFRIAVVSGSQRAEIEWNLRSLDLLTSVDFFLGAEDVIRGKPAPDPFLEGMRLMKVAPSSVVIFEDSSAGIHSASEAGAGLIVAVEAANRLGQDQSASDVRIPDWRGVTASWIQEVWRR